MSELFQTLANFFTVAVGFLSAEFGSLLTFWSDPGVPWRFPLACLFAGLVSVAYAVNRGALWESIAALLLMYAILVPAVMEGRIVIMGAAGVLLAIVLLRRMSAQGGAKR